MGLKLHAVSHIGICVSDLEQSLGFYRDLLGFRETNRLEVQGVLASQLLQLPDVDLAAIYLERDGLTLELLYYRHPDGLAGERPRPMNQHGLTHISLQAEDPAAALAEFRAQGVEVLDSTVVQVGGAVVAFLLLDPDGQTLEITAVRKLGGD